MKSPLDRSDKTTSRLTLSHIPVVLLLIAILAGLTVTMHALASWLLPETTFWKEVLTDIGTIIVGVAISCLILFSRRLMRVRILDLYGRREIESAFLASQARYQELAESIGDIFCAADGNLHITYWNKATEKRSGIPAQEALGKPVLQVVPILEGTPILAMFQRVLETRQPERATESFLLVDETLTVDISAYPSTSGLSVFIREITDQVRAQQRLRESEAFANKILTSSLNGLYIFDIQASQIIFINPQYTQLTGYTLADLHAMSGPEFLERFHPEDRGKVADHIEQVSRAAHAEIFEIEYRFQTADGRWIWCLSRETAFTRNEDGSVKQYIGTFVDITEHKQAAETIKTSQERYQTLFEDSPIPLWEENFSGIKQALKDLRAGGVRNLEAYFESNPEQLREVALQARLIDANRAACTLSGTSIKEDLLGVPKWVIDADSFAAHKQSILAIAHGRLQFEAETVIFQQDGKPVNVRINWSVAHGHEQTFDKVLVSVVDITKRKRAEQALQESESHFRSLFDNSPVALLVEDFSDAKRILDDLRKGGVVDFQEYFQEHPEDLAGVIARYQVLDANQATLDLSGIASKEAYLARLHPQLLADPSKLLAEVTAIAEGRLHFHEAQTGWNFSGKRMDLEIHWMVVPGHEQDLSRVIVSVIDVTELKKAETALRESELHYRSIFDNSPIPLIEQDFSGAKQYLDALREAGVVDFARYFQEHPEALVETLSRYQVGAANQAALEVYGVKSVQEYVDFIKDEFLADPPNLLTEVLAIAGGRTEFQGVERRWTVSGKTIYLVVRWVAVAGHEQDLSRVIISLMNVTENREAERALSASEGRYRALFEYSPISLWEEDFSKLHTYIKTLQASGIQDLGKFFSTHPEEIAKCMALTRVLNVNQATVDLYQAASKPELLGALERTVGGNFLEIQSQSIQAIAAGKTQFAIEAKNRTLAGEDLDLIVRWSIPPGYEDSYDLALVSVFDLTGLKRVEADLRRRNEELTALNEIATILAEPLDLKGALTGALDKLIQVTRMKGGWVQILDADSQSLRLETQRGLSKRMAKEVLLIPVGKYVTGQVAKTGEMAIFQEISPDSWPGIRSATREGFQSFFAVPIKARNQVLGVVGVFDLLPRSLEPADLQVLTASGYQLGMTIERARLARDAAQIEILQELNRLRSELIANVSHELRTPLGLIKISTTALLSQNIQLDPDTARELLCGINEEADRLEAIIGNLLDLSRLENHRLAMNKKPVNLADLLRSSADSMRPQLGPQHWLVVTFPSERLVLSLDAERIVQVLRNLIGNAIKYSPDGGTIELTGSFDEAGVQVSVIDQGIGIPAADLERVFDRFYRVENESTLQVAGVGLGLPVSQAIIQAHGGRIWVDSTPGAGSRFTFYLPIESPLGETA